MSTTPTILTARRRVRRKRHAVATTPPPPPAAVTVLSVTVVDEQRVLWNFSSPVVSWSEASGLLVGGQEPDAVEAITPEGSLRVEYSSGVSVDDLWEINAFPPVSITFASGGALTVPQSGNVV